MTNIGDLNRRLVLQEPVESADGLGGVTRSYQTVTTLWAELWARAMTLGGAVLATLLSLSSDPNVGAAIQSVLQPKLIPYYVIVIGVLTELARRRTVNKATTSANKVIG